MPAAGQVIRALDSPPLLKVDEEANESGISSTTFIPGAAECSGTFVAPTSGRVHVDFSARLAGDNTNATRVSFEVYEGSDAGGSLVHSPAANIAVDRVGGAFATRSNFYALTGLTRGTTHFIRTMHLVDGGSGGAIIRRQLEVRPAT